MIGDILVSPGGEFPHPFTMKKRTTLRIGHTSDPSGQILITDSKAQAEALRQRIIESTTKDKGADVGEPQPLPSGQWALYPLPQSDKPGNAYTIINEFYKNNNKSPVLNDQEDLRLKRTLLLGSVLFNSSINVYISSPLDVIQEVRKTEDDRKLDIWPLVETAPLLGMKSLLKPHPFNPNTNYKTVLFLNQQTESWVNDGREVLLAEKAIFRITSEPLFHLSLGDVDSILTNTRVASMEAMKTLTDKAIEHVAGMEGATKEFMKQARDIAVKAMDPDIDAITLPSAFSDPKRVSIIFSNYPRISSPQSEELWLDAGRKLTMQPGKNLGQEDAYKQLAIIAHELGHSTQEYLSMRKNDNDGGVAFMSDYLQQWVVNLGTYDEDKAYSAITYEIVGHAIQNAVEDIFSFSPNAAANRLAFAKLVQGTTDGEKLPGGNIAVYQGTPKLNDAEAATLQKEFMKYYVIERDALRKKYGQMNVNVEAIK
jgi:hypothetical protein